MNPETMQNWLQPNMCLPSNIRIMFRMFCLILSQPAAAQHERECIFSNIYCMERKLRGKKICLVELVDRLCGLSADDGKALEL